MSTIELTKALAERIVPIVAAAAEKPALICGKGGIILAATSNRRVGAIHEGAAAILRGQADEIAIDAADHHADGPSYMLVVRYKGQRVGTVGIGGEAGDVGDAARLAVHVVAMELEAQEQKHRIRQDILAGLENASAAAEEILAGTENHLRLADHLEKATADLQERSRAATQALRVISDLAQKANLLGLNAAVEAAHAGRQGAGFTVVADEIRKLADRTSKSAGEINAALAEWQKSFEFVAGRVTESSQVARKQAAAIRSVSDEIQHVQTGVAALTE